MPAERSQLRTGDWQGNMDKPKMPHTSGPHLDAHEMPFSSYMPRTPPRWLFLVGALGGCLGSRMDGQACAARN